MTQTPGRFPLSEIERALFDIYTRCTLSLSHPRQLYQTGSFTYEQLAAIAGCSIPTMTRWMNRDKEPRMLKEVYLRRLGEFYFLLNYYQQIPVEVWDSLCPLPIQVREILYPSPHPE